MLTKRKVSSRFSLNVFLSKTITPVVLLTGLLVLAVYNFQIVLKNSQQQDDNFHGSIFLRQEALSLGFKQFTGLDRPDIQYNGNDLISYVEWDSTISVDGTVTDLWKNYHGYSIDEKNLRIYSTISGDGWQLIQIVSLVDGHTATVDFNFVARPQAFSRPKHFVFDIVHTHSFWYNPRITSKQFTASVMNGDPAILQNEKGKSQLRPTGTITLTVKGATTHVPSLKIEEHQYQTSTYGGKRWTTSLATEYAIDQPPPFQMIPLGTETIAFRPA